LLDQLHSHALGVGLAPPDSIEIAYRVRTLHREGHPQDDKARLLWDRFLKQRYDARDEEATELLTQMEESFPKTRYARLGDGLEKGFLSTGIGGAASAIVIPAFVKYIRRAKAAEAPANLRRLAAAAQARYGSGERIGQDGTVQAQGFPEGDTGWTPERPCCTYPKKKCPPLGPDSLPTTWSALGGLPHRPFRFQYRYVGAPQASPPRFTVQARGDLDCDEDFSLYTLEGRVRNGRVVLGDIQVQKPLE
jgi:type II secretory pathway pseudopilin PulG